MRFLTCYPSSLDIEDESSPEVPVLHVLCYQVASSGPTLANVDSSLRTNLIEWLSDEALGGDKDAAEWILLQLTSKSLVENDTFLDLLLIDILDTVVQSHFSPLPSQYHAFLSLTHRISLRHYRISLESFYLSTSSFHFH